MRDRIETGNIEAGRFLPTERELQVEFGASRSTVRRALAHLVEGGWATNVPSKGVVAGYTIRRAKTNNVALIDNGSYVLRVLTVRLSELLRERGFHLVHLGGSNDFPLEEQLQYAMDNDFAGALVWPYTGFPDVDLVTRTSREMAIVTMDHRLRGVPTDVVTFDYMEAAAEATDHLVKMGCRRIGVAGMLDMLETTHDRFSGYMRSMFANHMLPNASDYLFTFTSAMSRPDNRLLEHRLRQPDRPDGLLVLQDEFLPSVVETALKVGLHLPGDLKLVCIGDDVDVSVGEVGMTSVALDWEALALEALNLLIQRIEEPSRGFRVRLAPHRLVVRGLCGAPSTDWSPAPDELTGFHGDLPYPRSQFRFSSNWSASADPQSITQRGGNLT